MNLHIMHDKQIISFAYINYDNRILYTYYFELDDGQIKLHSIDAWVKNSINGNTYKHEEIYHFEYKNRILLENGEFGKPKIPADVLKWAECYRIGYLNTCL